MENKSWLARRSGTAAANRPDRPLAALGWMMASALGFTVMTVHVKRLSPAIPEFELVFFRSFINLVWVFLLVLASRQSLWPKSDKPLLLFRGVVGFMGVACMFYSIGHLPLPVASMLNWSSPLFVILLSRLFLRERMPAWSGLFIPIAFTGLCLLLDPFSATGKPVALFATFIGLLTAFFGGMAYVAVRAVTARVGPDVIVFYFTLVAVLISAPLASTGFVMPSKTQWPEVLSLGTFAAIGQLTMTRAYRHAPAGVVSLMSLLNPVFGAVIGFFVFREALAAMQWAGVALVGTALAGLTTQSARSRTASSVLHG